MGAANVRGDVRRTKGEEMAKKKKKTAKRAARKSKKKAHAAKKRATRRKKSARKAARTVGKKSTATAQAPLAVTPASLPQRSQAPARALKPQSARQDSLREALPDDIEIDDDLADEVPATVRDGMDDDEPLDEEGRDDYLDKPDELSGEDEE
jgi:hypothetical protein